MKRNKKNELDFDIIGGEGPLTEEEKNALNDYFRSKKQNEKQRHSVIKAKSKNKKQHSKVV